MVEPSDQPAAKPSETPVKAPAQDPFDRLVWMVPLECKDCGRIFEAPYRHLKAGVVFHCPHCHGSYVPTVQIYCRVRDTFETFYGRTRSERDKALAAGNQAAFEAQYQAELAAFRKSLERLAHELRPAGKMVKRKGLGAMFT